MHQPIPQLVINLYHKQVHQPCTNLVINLYHKQVHQPCTKYVPIMCQLLINYESSICTNIINYTHHVCAPTHQLFVSTMYPTCTTTKSPHPFHHQNMMCSSIIDLVYMLTFLQTFLNFKNKRLEFSSNFSLVSHS
jgi:hypothetical protein